MPVEMVVGDVRDRRAIQRQRIGEMQLERAELHAQRVVVRIDRGVGHRLADVADRRCNEASAHSMAEVISVVDVLPFVPVMPTHGAGRPVRALSTRSRHASSTSLYTGMPRRWASRMNACAG